MLLERFRVNRLQVEVYAGREELGRAAGRAAESVIVGLQQSRPGPVRVILAAAPSQDATLATLAASAEIDWSRVVAFQMDEYVDMAVGASQLFSRYLDRALFERGAGARFERIDANAEPQREAVRYARLVTEAPIDLCCLGIGENGHLAFNDPPEARADDPQPAKVVRLTESARLQQLHDGCFQELGSVPRCAITLTIPTLMAARSLICSVPGVAKGPAVAAALGGAPVQICPASVLLDHPCARLFLDCDAWGQARR